MEGSDESGSDESDSDDSGGDDSDDDSDDDSGDGGRPSIVGTSEPSTSAPCKRQAVAPSHLSLRPYIAHPSLLRP